MNCIMTAGWEDGVAALTERLVRELAGGQRVLWLVSGGSNIPASISILGNIPAKLRPRLSIMPIDERYGPVGHADSNWAQLLQAGLRAEPATLLPVLQKGLDFSETVARYNRLAAEHFKNHDVIIAQIGIGSDGHLAGILPNSPATEETAELAVGYESPPFKRLTLTFAALRQLTAAYAFAFGETKHQALKALKSKKLPLEEQPAQILKELPEAYVYSDQWGHGR